MCSLMKRIIPYNSWRGFYNVYVYSIYFFSGLKTSDTESTPNSVNRINFFKPKVGTFKLNFMLRSGHVNYNYGTIFHQIKWKERKEKKLLIKIGAFYFGRVTITTHFIPPSPSFSTNSLLILIQCLIRDWDACNLWHHLKKTVSFFFRH